MSQNKPKRHLEDGEIRRAIVDFAADPEEEAATMSEKELDLYLAGIGVDVNAQARRFRAAKNNADGKMKLTAAREQRLSGQETPQPKRHGGNWATRGIEELKAEVERRLGTTNNQSPQAAAYFRKLENASEDDLLGMLEDLAELDERSDNS